MAVSAGTHVMQALAIQRKNDTMMSLMQKLCRSLGHCEDLADADLRDMNVWVDRGILFKGVVELLLSIGVNISGTAPKQHFPIAFGPPGARRSAPTMIVPSEGDVCSYSVKSTVKVRSENTTIWKYAIRFGHGSPALFATSDGNYSPSHWIYEKTRIDYRRVSDDEDSEDEKIDGEDRALPQHRFLIDQVAAEVTSGQGGREWFHLRKFRTTSTVAHSVFDVASHMLRSVNVDTIKPFGSCQPYPTKESLTQDSIEVLKRKIKTLNISPPGNKTAANYVKVLMDFYTDHKGVMYHCLVHNWFMVPFSTKSTREGSANEIKILLGLEHFIAITQEENDPFRITVRVVETRGLLVNRSDRLAATSVDGIVRYNELQADGSTFEKEAVVEIKTHCTVASIRTLRRDADNNGMQRCFAEPSNPEKFIELVPNQSHRIQILHHAAVTGCPNVFFVEGTITHIVRCVGIWIPDFVRSAYMAMLAELHLKYYDWVLDNSMPMPDLPQSCFKRCPDMYTLHQHLMIFRCLDELVEIHGPMAKCRRILPALCLLITVIRVGLMCFFD
jgi:hypothetical protein